MNTFIFYKSAKNRLTELVIAVVLTVLPLKLALTQYKNKSYFPVIFFTTLLIFGLLLLLRNLRSKKTLTLNEQGIVCRTNAIGLVEWKYIEDIVIVKASHSNVLVFKVNNTEELLNKKNKAIALLMRSNIKPLGSPVVIAENEFDQPLEEVVVKIKEFQEQIKK